MSGCTEGKKVKWHLTPLLTLAVNNEEGVQILINAGLWLRANRLSYFVAKETEAKSPLGGHRARPLLHSSSIAQD